MHKKDFLRKNIIVLRVVVVSLMYATVPVASRDLILMKKVDRKWTIFELELC